MLVGRDWRRRQRAPQPILWRAVAWHPVLDCSVCAQTVFSLHQILMTWCGRFCLLSRRDGAVPLALYPGTALTERRAAPVTLKGAEEEL